MTEADRIRILRIVLVLVGLTCAIGIWPLAIIWPSGWSWHAEGRSYYLMATGQTLIELRNTGSFCVWP